MGALEHKEETFDLEYQRQLIKEADESLYLLKEYGLQAWLDLSAFDDEKEIIKCLIRIQKTLERNDKFEDCIYLRDVIIPMYQKK